MAICDYFFKVFILFFFKFLDELKRGVVSQINSVLHVEIKSSEKDREYIRNLIINAWKKINEYQFANPHVSQGFIGIGVALNLARMAQCS
jgi:hypothetical protein